MPDAMAPLATEAPIPLGDAIVAEQVRLLVYRRADLPMNLLIAAIVAATIGPLYRPWVVVSWLCLIVIVILIRYLSRRTYQGAPPTTAMARRWGRIFTFNAFATASLWSLTGSVILVTPDPIFQVFIVFVLGGMIAGGMVSNAAYLPTMVAFVVPAILPMTLLLFSRHSMIHVEMAVMLTAFGTVVIMAGRGINRSIFENLRIRFEQDILLTKLRASESAMENAQAVARVGSWEYDLQTKALSWTPETFRIFGVDPRSFAPSWDGAFARVDPLDRDSLLQAIRGLEANHTGLTADYRIVMNDGTQKWVHGIVRTSSDDGGTARKLVGTVQDIAERKQGEHTKALLAAIVDSSVDAIVSETTDGTITSWNHAAERLYGYRAEEIVGKNVRLIVPDERQEEIERHLRAIAQGRPFGSFDTERLTRDGTRIPVSIAVSLTRDTAGAVTGASFIARDIRERKHAAAALAERDRLLHAVTVGVGLLVKADSLDQGMPDALRTVGESLRVDRVLVMQESAAPASPPALAYYWQSPGIEKPLAFGLLPLSPQDAAALDAWRARMNEGEPLIAQLATSEGPVRAMLGYFGNQSTLQVPILVGGKLWGNIGIDSCSVPRDWTASEIDTLKTFGEIVRSLIVRDETRRALARSNERFRMLTTAAQDGIVTVGETGLINQWNLGAERILGYSAAEAMGKSAHRLLAPPCREDDADPIMAAGKASFPQGRTLELMVRRKDGGEIAVELSVSAAQVGGQWETIGILRDVTARKRADTELRFANILLKTQMEASPDGILVVGPNRDVISYNQKFLDIWKLAFIDAKPAGGLVALMTGAAAVKDPAGFLSRVAYLHDHPGESSREEFDMADGRCIDRYTVTLAASAGGNLGRVWYFRDITDRKLAAGALAYREHLLHAVTISTETLVKANSLKQGMPDALRILGETLRVDRMLVLQEFPGETSLGTLPALRHLWETSGIEAPLDASRSALSAAQRVAFAGWHAPLSANEAVVTHLAGSEGPVRDLLARLGIKSTLLVPIFAGGTLWGSLGIDACRVARDWTASEIDALRIFGEITGSLNAHDETRQALERSEKRFRSVSETAQDAIISIDAEARIVLWNNAAERMLGYSAAEAVGRPVHELLAPPRFRTEADQAMAHFRLTGEGNAIGKTTEFSATRKDGTEIVVELSLAIARIGDRQEAIGMVRDITGRKIAEQRILFANTLLKSEMEASPHGIIVVGPDRKITLVNRRFAEIWKLSAADLADAQVDAVMDRARPLLEDADNSIALIEHLLDSPGENAHREFVLTDGRTIDRDILTLSGAAGEYLGRVGYYRDITDSKAARARLAFSNLLLRTQMEASLDGILVVDEHANIISFNQRFLSIWKIPQSDLASGLDETVLAKVASMAKDPATFIARVRHLYDHPGEDSQDEFETADGRSIDRYSVTLYSPVHAYLGRAWFFRDITERKRVEALALRMARYDVLTGLANRVVFVEALKHAIAMGNRGERGFAVLYLDLDHFKDINDTLGHPVGDELLKAVAERLTACMRDTDTLARFGGDEFALIAADIRDPADAAIMADKLASAFEKPFMIQASEIHIGASIGIATYGSDAPDAETLLSNADVALYRTKSEGRGGFRFFTGAMDDEVQARVTLGAELRTAIDAGQLFLLYQPQVAIADGRITGMEALVRWHHPTRGILPPGIFIPVAEQIGIVGKLGHWVLWEACRQGKVWLDAGIAPKRIAVNVSSLQFRAPLALEADIAAAMAQTGFPPCMLELELTESVLMDASRANIDVLQRLRSAGITIAIDDFGTGYSSLQYLRSYPSNRIKIAQNFVTNLVTTPGDAAIVRATIGLARELSIDVIAEGAETQAQCDLLKSWGCDEVQGYYFARPLGPDDAAAALRAGRIVPVPPGVPGVTTI